MADKHKTPIAQDAQGAQEKREKRHRTIDQAIEAAKAEKTSMKTLYINTKIVPPFDAVNWDAIDPDSPNYDPEKAKEYGKLVLEYGQETADKAKLQATANEKLRKAVQAIQEALNLSTANVRIVLDELFTSPNLISLYPYLKKLAAGPEYAQYGTDPEEIIERLEFQGTDQNGDIIHGSAFEKLIDQAADYWEAEQVKAEGRKQRKAAKEQAQGINAIMTLKKGELPFLSPQELWAAFAPGRIFEIGSLDPAFIDNKTGLIRKPTLEAGEIKNVNQAAPIQAFLLLNAIVANSVEDYRKDFVKSGDITFYVKGVLDNLSADPRGLIPAEIAQDGQLNIDRKTAGALFFENIFKPLLPYIGQLPNGSRYTVLSYKGYDADSDTITINTPYIYQLWKRTQSAYFQQIENKRAAIAAGKKPEKKDLTPFKVNRLIKGPGLTENQSTLEAAMYITNVMLAAGTTKNAPKETNITFQKIVDNCPAMQQRIAEIESSDMENKPQLVNSELRKIEKAVALILNPEKCSATEVFNIVEITPAKVLVKKEDWEKTPWHRRIKFIPPTKSKLKEQLHIKWYRETDSEES